MLKAMSGVHGVPELIDHWLVKRSDNIVDQTRDYRRAENPSIQGTHRMHVRLVMKPCARPLHAFQTLKEFVRVIRDIAIIQCKAVERSILHRDCSLYNVMIMGKPNDSNGLLFDWEFAVFITSNDEYSIGGTGTIPFMSRALLAQMAELQTKVTQQEACKSSSKNLALPPSRVSQSFADDLESLFYVFTYVCIKYSGPNDEERQEPVPDSLPDSWSTLDLEDNMETRITFDHVLELLECHLATLQDDEERSSTNEKLRKSAEELTHHMNKWAAEAGGSTSISSPQLAKRKKHEAGDSDTSVAHAMVESEDSDSIYDF
ncbi:hypothetical protein DFH29DRAFT_880522 [Suillus ampliporus]|nr:hypothetical protein DFH29DRAFT_880522 [Suillus ampliporus]